MEKKRFIGPQSHLARGRLRTLQKKKTATKREKLPSKEFKVSTRTRRKDMVPARTEKPEAPAKHQGLKTGSEEKKRGVREGGGGGGCETLVREKQSDVRAVVP